MGDKELLESLHPLERKVLRVIEKRASLPEMAKESGLSEVEVTRALQWMENKNLLKISKSEEDIMDLDSNGRLYLKKGLPEKRFLKALDGDMKLEEIARKAELDRDEINICLGILRRKAAISVMGGVVSPTGNRKKLLDSGMQEEALLKRLPMEFARATPEEKSIFAMLERRKEIVTKKKRKAVSVELTPAGIRSADAIRKGDVDENMIERLTPKMLKDGSWKGKGFRRFDVEINVPRIHGGKRHFVSQAIEYAKSIWLDMGFREMTGPMVESSFWVFDALFTPQDHPVRDMQDTFFIKDPQFAKLPKSTAPVKSSHENGYGTDSRGWEYRWKEEEARRNVMRTHTTSLSAKTLAGLGKSTKKGKYFALGRCFRNETVDWSHLFEFNQTEGIVIDPDANFRHLLGYLKEFFRRMGFPKARFRPAYFAYTEPSVEIDAYHPVHKTWIELGGAGMFRPEVTKPLLGEEVPVLAWGPGFDRTMMDYYGITDMRLIYGNDLRMLKETRMWLR